VPYCAFLAYHGSPVAERWLIYLVPAVLALFIYLVATRGAPEHREPLPAMQLARAHFRDDGWWVLFWLVLILLFSTVFTRG
jgi:hypothetical protein